MPVPSSVILDCRGLHTVYVFIFPFMLQSPLELHFSEPVYHNERANSWLRFSSSVDVREMKNIEQQDGLCRMSRIKSFVPNESRPSSTRVNPIRGTRVAGFPLLMPDTFTEPHKDASQAAHY